MIAMTLAQLAELAGGTLDGADPGARVHGPVVVDSRQVRPGGVFAALRGEHVDGHDFARSAVDAGAAAVLAARPCGMPAVVVDDVPVALGRLARAVHDRLPGATVVGVTGSSGKTSTKDLIATLLGRLGPTVAPRESYNNEIGHPLTVLRADISTRYLVLELSARGAGHIASLAETAPPRIGAVLNVGSAHLGEFGTREAIARAKGELAEALPADGAAVLNVDDPLVAAMAARTRARVVTCGTSADAEVRAESVRMDERARPSFTLATPHGSAPVSLALHGEHHVGNCLAAAAVARECGMPVAEIASALTGAVPVSRWRMEVRERTDGVTVLNDAYNANPESVRAAVGVLADMGRERRTWAVLGEMAELGGESADAHRDIGRLLADRRITGVITVGAEAAAIAQGYQQAGEPVTETATETVEVADADDAIAALRRRLQPGDVVLVKGSRVARLERVAAALHADDSHRPGDPQGGEVPA